MRVTWQTFENGGRKAEGQVWEPDAGSRRGILFCPGFPGRGATIFEQRHAAVLAEQGYALIVLRHAGTRIDSPDAPFIINNGARLHAARTAGETHLGGGPSTIENWLWEPFAAMGAIADRYDELIVLGNSFGAVSALWSLTREGVDTAAIRKVMLIAGAQGIDSDPVQGIMRVWNPAVLANPLFWEKITLDDPVSISLTMKAAYNQLPDKVRALPGHIALTYLVVLNDEILKRSDTDAFRAAIGGRGDIVLDDIDRAHPPYGFLAHDMADYPTAKLLEILQ